MTFRTREEVLLAKIAGYDVDVSTLTPPPPINTTEKLMLEIAEKLGATAESAAKKASYVAPAAGSAPTAAEFKALLDSLTEAGLMAAQAANAQPSDET